MKNELWFNEEEINKYYDEQSKLEREIEGLWEVNKKSPAKERRLKEVNFIIEHLATERLLNDANKVIKAYKKRYGSIDVSEVENA